MSEPKSPVTVSTFRGIYAVLADVASVFLLMFFTVLEQDITNLINHQGEFVTQLLRAFGITGPVAGIISHLRAPQDAAVLGHESLLETKRETKREIILENHPKPVTQEDLKTFFDQAAARADARRLEEMVKVPEKSSIEPTGTARIKEPVILTTEPGHTLNNTTPAPTGLTYPPIGSKRYAWAYSPTSQRRLDRVVDGVALNPDIVRLITEAMAYCPFDIGIAYLGAVRSLDEQRGLVDQGGVTSILNSRHLHGMAIDVICYDKNGKYTKDFRYYEVFEQAVQYASKKLGIPYIWGGSWESKDGPHFELPKYELAYADLVNVSLELA